MAATTTKSKEKNHDNYGIERVREDEPGFVDKMREKSDFFDHVMRTVERYGAQGGNQFAAGITYFSVLAVFPIAMLIVAAAAQVLAGRPELFASFQNQITESLEGQMGEIANEILEGAVERRGAVAGIGGLTALWTGLNWMHNLRAGISAMWNMDPNDGANFVVKKINDLLGLVGLILAFIIAFGITAAGSSGIVFTILEWLHVEDVMPGLNYILFFSALFIGILANFLVMWWLVVILPRKKVPKKAGFIGALLGALVFEVIKQLFTVILSSATGSPTGAIFGPIIALMIVLYLIWRVVLYVSAFTATTKQARATEEVPVPEPAVIRVRHEVKQRPSTRTLLGAGAGLGAAGGWALRRIFKAK